jgi:hypothetical protein
MFSDRGAKVFATLVRAGRDGGIKDVGLQSGEFFSNGFIVANLVVAAAYTALYEWGEDFAKAAVVSWLGRGVLRAFDSVLRFRHPESQALETLAEVDLNARPWGREA